MKKSGSSKTLSLVCALALAMTTFAGCGSGSQTSSDSASSPSPVSAASGSDLSKHVTFTMSMIDSEKAGKNADGSEAENLKWLEKKFNFDIKPQALTWNNYIDQTRLWLTAGNAPDLIMLDIAPTRYSEFTQWVDDGLFKAYPDLSKYPNLKKRLDGMLTGKKFMIDNTLYAWPAYIDNQQNDYKKIDGYLYRKDWAQTVGLDQPDGIFTQDQWINLVKAVVQKDPGKNGAGKTIGMLTEGIYQFPLYFGVNGISPYLQRYVKNSSGQWVWGPTLPESAKAVKQIKQWYDDGLIWKDQILGKGDTGKRFENGLAFSCVEENVTVPGLDLATNDFKKAFPDLDPSKVFGFAMVKGADGKFTVYQSSDQWSQTAMNASIDDEKASRWCEILDYLVSDEGYYFRGFGIPGKDWTMGSDGKPVIQWKKDASGNYVAPYASDGTWPWSRTASALDLQSLSSPAFPQWERDMVQNAYNIQNKYASDVNLIKLDPDLEYFQGANYNKIGNDEAEVYTVIEKLMTSKNVESDWNAWVQSKKGQIQPALDELNSKLK